METVQQNGGFTLFFDLILLYTYLFSLINYLMSVILKNLFFILILECKPGSRRLQYLSLNWNVYEELSEVIKRQYFSKF